MTERPVPQWQDEEAWLRDLGKAVPNTLHAILVEVDRALPADEIAAFGALLDAEDQARATKLRFAEDRNRFVIAHGALTLVASRALGVKPRAVAFASGPRTNMPPQLAASPGSAAPNLSLSHAGPYIAIAVGFGCPVGIDVEWRRMLDDLDGMARLALTATEAKDLATLSADAKNDAFLRWWTAKEAALKAIGRGFSTPPDEVSLRYDAALLPDAALIPDGSTTHRYRISSYDKSPAAIVAIATADGVAIAVSAVKATQILRWC